MANVGELKALLEGKNDSDIVEVVAVPNYVINIKTAMETEPVNESVAEVVEATEEVVEPAVEAEAESSEA